MNQSCDQTLVGYPLSPWIMNQPYSQTLVGYLPSPCRMNQSYDHTLVGYLPSLWKMSQSYDQTLVGYLPSSCRMNQSYDYTLVGYLSSLRIMNRSCIAFYLSVLSNQLPPALSGSRRGNGVEYHTRHRFQLGSSHRAACFAKDLPDSQLIIPVIDTQTG